MMLLLNQVDWENLMMAGRLNILMVGQDVLRTNNEVRTLQTRLLWRSREAPFNRQC